MASTPIIADTGFRVALLSRSDAHHARAVGILRTLDRSLVTTGPVLTETCHILLRRGGVATLVLLAEALGSGDILSTDRRDFNAYRWKNRKPFNNLLLPH